MPLRVCVAGVTGWTGSAVAEAVDAAPDLELGAGVARSDPASYSTVAEALDAAPVDVLVDYTSAAAVKENVLAAVDRRVAAVVGSSGLSTSDYEEIDERARAQQVGVIAAGNFSITATLMKRFALMAAKYVPDVEVIDYASARKPDAPSGTARELAEALAEIRQASTARPIAEVSGVPGTRGAAVGAGEGVQVHALRLPSYILSCEALFGLPDERLTIRHDAGSSAAPYVAGTLLAIRRVQEITGLVRGLDALMD